MRAGPQLRVAKAARAPPCTLPILGRRFILTTKNKALTFFIFLAINKIANQYFFRIGLKIT